MRMMRKGTRRTRMARCIQFDDKDTKTKNLISRRKGKELDGFGIGVGLCLCLCLCLCLTYRKSLSMKYRTTQLSW